jgi:uncharacterized phage protein (TIGR01671 family)
MGIRTIIFRGKRVDNGEWVYGYYIKADHHWHSHGIHEDWIVARATQNGGWFTVQNRHAVIPTSISEFTGLYDKNGKMIFEGDIVKILYTDWISQPLEDTRSLEEYLDSLTKKGVVDFAPYVGWYLKNGKYDLSIISGTHGYIEVIGNIHDNPELIGGGENA